MKKLFTAIIGTLCLTATASAQNIQLHYDFGRNIYSDEEASRPKVTATFEHFRADGHGQLVFLSEPQLWYNFTPHFSAGTEIDLSDSFIFNLYNDKTFFINPTLAVKYTF